MVTSPPAHQSVSPVMTGGCPSLRTGRAERVLLPRPPVPAGPIQNPASDLVMAVSPVQTNRSSHRPDVFLIPLPPPHKLDRQWWQAIVQFNQAKVGRQGFTRRS